MSTQVYSIFVKVYWVINEKREKSKSVTYHTFKKNIRKYGKSSDYNIYIYIYKSPLKLGTKFKNFYKQKR